MDKHTKWKDIDGYEDMPKERQEFCDWLVKPESERDIDSQYELAQELGVNKDTLTIWKHKDKFQEIVQKRKRDIVGIDNLHKVLDALSDRASKVNENPKEANDATEIFFKYLYGEDFGDTGVEVNVNQSQEQTEASPSVDLSDVPDDKVREYIEITREVLDG